jgi:hypothetical protein
MDDRFAWLAEVFCLAVFLQRLGLEPGLSIEIGKVLPEAAVFGLDVDALFCECDAEIQVFTAIGIENTQGG